MSLVEKNNDGQKQPQHVNTCAPGQQDHSEDSSHSLPTRDSDSASTGRAGKIRLWNRLTPPGCRWDAARPPRFSTWHNILFGFAGAFTVANLYYSHPILNILADDFGVDQLTISRLPTLCQAGYATGLFLVLPLGDLLPRRTFVLSLIFFTATLWIVLCTTTSFVVFVSISYLTAVTTVTPQIMLPLVSELSTAKQRPVALSIVVSGALLGIVIARILSGVVAQFTSWRNIYWVALGLQYLIFLLLYAFMPAYPATNPTSFRQFFVAYPKLLWSVVLLLPQHPILVQSGLIAYCMSVTFTNYWTTLTFLLSSPPYNLDPVPIGLFGLIGLAAIAMGPLYARYIFQPLQVPLYSVLLANALNLLGSTLATYTGKISLAGPIIQAFLMDAAMQLSQVANRTSLHAIEPTARNSVNTAFMLMSFLGQLTGTSAGNKLYSRGGWVASGSLSVAMCAVACNAACLARGPWEQGWIGWGGGWRTTDSRGMGAEEWAGGDTREAVDGDESPESGQTQRQTSAESVETKYEVSVRKSEEHGIHKGG